MVLKTTGLSSRSQPKNRYQKICMGFRNNKQNGPKIRFPKQTCIILVILANISGTGAYFFILIRPKIYCANVINILKNIF